jgi:hypothetical protein
MDWEELRERLASRLGGGWSLEPETVHAAVAAHRDYWKPDEVRVLLLAESHVLTHARELAATVDLAPYGHAGAPSEFVRLVYCLGYGEKALVPQVSPNPGSPQFWKLFAACVGDLQGARVLKGSERNTERRIQNKVALLEELKARGVWLLDASPAALYRSGGGKPKAKEVSSALEAAWSVYASGIVQALQPRVVMVIGKMVHDALEERVRQIVQTRDAVQWMYQPQAHVSAAEHADGLKRLWRMVEAHGKP